NRQDVTTSRLRVAHGYLSARIHRGRGIQCRRNALHTVTGDVAVIAGGRQHHVQRTAEEHTLRARINQRGRGVRIHRHGQTGGRGGSSSISRRQGEPGRGRATGGDHIRGHGSGRVHDVRYGHAIDGRG